MYNEIGWSEEIDKSLSDYFRKTDNPTRSLAKQSSSTGAAKQTLNSNIDVNKAASSKSGGSSWGAVAKIAGSAASSYLTNSQNNQQFTDRNRELRLDPVDAKAEKNTATNKKMDDLGTSVASAIGPWWGALAELGTEASKELQGDGTNLDKNIQGQFADPFNQFKNNEDLDDWVGSFFAPTASAHIKAGRVEKEAERQATKKLNTTRQSTLTKGALFQNSLDRYTAPGYGRKGMKIKNKLSYGSSY